MQKTVQLQSTIMSTRQNSFTDVLEPVAPNGLDVPVIDAELVAQNNSATENSDLKTIAEDMRPIDENSLRVSTLCTETEEPICYENIQLSVTDNLEQTAKSPSHLQKSDVRDMELIEENSPATYNSSQITITTGFKAIAERCLNTLVTEVMKTYAEINDHTSEADIVTEDDPIAEISDHMQVSEYSRPMEKNSLQATNIDVMDSLVKNITQAAVTDQLEPISETNRETLVNRNLKPDAQNSTVADDYCQTKVNENLSVVPGNSLQTPIPEVVEPLAELNDCSPEVDLVIDECPVSENGNYSLLAGGLRPLEDSSLQSENIEFVDLVAKNSPQAVLTVELERRSENSQVALVSGSLKPVAMKSLSAPFADTELVTHSNLVNEHFNHTAVAEDHLKPFALNSLQSPEPEMKAVTENGLVAEDSNQTSVTADLRLIAENSLEIPASNDVEHPVENNLQTTFTHDVEQVTKESFERPVTENLEPIAARSFLIQVNDGSEFVAEKGPPIDSIDSTPLIQDMELITHDFLQTNSASLTVHPVQVDWVPKTDVGLQSPLLHTLENAQVKSLAISLRQFVRFSYNKFQSGLQYPYFR
jgi:hypothetical protein